MPAPNSGCSKSIKRRRDALHPRTLRFPGPLRLPRTRHLRQHPRLVLSVLLGIYVPDLVPAASIGEGTRLLAAFDLAALAFLGAVGMP